MHKALETTETPHGETNLNETLTRMLTMTEDNSTIRNHWTVETLREYILALIASNDVKYLERFEASQIAAGIAFTAQQTAMLTALTAQKLAVDTALNAADRAGTKLEIAADKRFEGLNELRGMVTDQQATFMQRLEAMALLKAIDDRITAIQLNNETRQEAQRIATDKSIENLAKEIAGLREYRSEAGGARVVMRELVAYGIAAAGVIFAIIFHFIK